MSESEIMTHALGMKARLAGKSRNANPFFTNGMDGMAHLLCVAWFRGWDDADRASKAASS